MGLFSKKSAKASASVQRIDAMLQDAFVETFSFDGEDHWVGREGSTVVCIQYYNFPQGVGVVRVDAMVIRDVVATPALCSELLTNPDYNRLIGRWDISADDETPGKSIVNLGMTLLDAPEHLVAGELLNAVILIAERADEVDDVLAAKFGGKTALQAYGN